MPARGGSKRLPRKNVAPLLGRPLLAWALDAALGSGIFDAVWVSTDDNEIAARARQLGASVDARPPRLASDTASVVEVTLDFARRRREAGEVLDAICVVLPTAALLKPEDLRGAYAVFHGSEVDVVMGVTRYLETPFQALHEVDGYLRCYFVAEALKRKQELPDVCVDSGYFYFARLEPLARAGTFYGGRLRGFPIPRERSVDVDEPADLRIAEALLSYQLRVAGAAAAR